MFTKPVGEDNASPAVTALDDGAERIEHIRGRVEESFGLKLTFKGVVVGGLIAFGLLRGFVTGARHNDLSVTLTAAAMLLGYAAIFLMGKMQRQQEAQRESVMSALRLLRPVMWLSGRWWGTILLLLMWPFVFVWVYTMASSLMPILLGIAAFWLLWTIGNRLLAHA